MTNAVEKRLSVGELEERTPEGQREMAASRVMVRAASVLDRAFELSGRTQRDLAEDLGVSEGRVSQVLRGTGNIKLSTLARYLRAMGYLVDLKVDPVDGSVAPLERQRRRNRRAGQSSENELWGSLVEHDGQQAVKMTLLPPGIPLNAPEVTSPKQIGIATAHGSNAPSGPAQSSTGQEINVSWITKEVGK